MATFNIDKATLLTITKSGRDKLKQEMLENEIVALKDTVKKWNYKSPKNFKWEGDVTIENYHLKCDNLPYDFKIDFKTTIYNYNENLRSEFNQLTKWFLIAKLSTGDITMNDEEFCKILNQSNYKEDLC